MKSKEEILKDYWDGKVPFDENIIIYYPALLNAMDEYAGQMIANSKCVTTTLEIPEQLLDSVKMKEAIEFANFIKDNSYTKSDKGWYKYYTKVENYPAGFGMLMPVYDFLTIESIYEIYLKTKLNENL